MPNKTRFVIYPDRDYVIKLDDGDEVSITGKEIVGMVKINEIIRCFTKLDEMEDNE